MTICSVEGCDKVAKRRGWCDKHYQRWWEYGDPLTPFQTTEKGKPQAFIEIALKHQDKEACFFWPFAKGSNGYAIHKVGATESQLVHRRICEVVHGPPPSSKHEACHNCGKGHLGCINPHHLRWDTHYGNSLDMVIHGTITNGERNSEAKLTWEKAREIRAMKGTLSVRKVAAIYGVGRTAIHAIWTGRRWKEQLDQHSSPL